MPGATGCARALGPVPVGAASTECCQGQCGPWPVEATSVALYPLRPSVMDWLYPPDEAAAGAPEIVEADGVEDPQLRVDLPPGAGEVLPAVDGEAAAEPDEPEHPAEEARAARPSRDPGAPTQAQRDAHAATHLPFRSWCDECVQGRRDAPPHCRQKRGAGAVP